MLGHNAGAWILFAACLLQFGCGRRLQIRQEISQPKSAFLGEDQRANVLCTQKVINDARETLGVTGADDPALISSKLQNILGANEQDVEILLNTVFGDSGSSRFLPRLDGEGLLDTEFDDSGFSSTSYSVESLCERAVSSIPNILGAAIPSAPWLACLDGACRKGQISMSEEELVKSDLVSPAPDASDEDEDVIEPMDQKAERTDPEKRVQDHLRVVLAVVFGIFPPEKSLGKLLPLGKLLTKFADNVGLIPFTSQDRQEFYRKFILRARSWITVGIRRIDSGRKLVRKWFNLRTKSAIDEQLNVTRRHLSLMLASTYRISILAGMSYKTGGQCRGGTVAYVRQFAPWPDVTDFREIGEMRDGRYVIHICDHFWTGNLSEAARVGTIVHESSHHFGTVDKGYCDKIDCLKLSPDDARNNADSYVHFIRELVKDSPDTA